MVDGSTSMSHVGHAAEKNQNKIQLNGYAAASLKPVISGSYWRI